MGKGHLVIKSKIDNKSFESQIEQTKKYLESLENSYKKAANPGKGFERDEKALKKLQVEIEKTQNKLIQLQRQQLNEVNNSLEKTNMSIGGIIKKVGKWALAVFSVRSAYMLIRRLVSTISQYNDQVRTDLEYMNYALSKAFEGVVQWLINAMYKLLSLVNSITKALFDWDMFTNASVKNFKKMQAGAKAVKKELLGFDELNILGSEDSASGAATPSVDLSNFNNDNLSNNIQESAEIISQFWEQDLEAILSHADSIWTEFTSGVLLTCKGVYDFIKGVIETIQGIWETLVGVFTGDTQKMEEGYTKLVEGLGKLVKGLVEFIIGLLWSVVGIFLDVLNGIWKMIKNFGSWLSNGIKSIGKSIGNFFTSIWTGFKEKVVNPITNGIKKLWDGAINGAKNAWQGIKNVFSGIGSFFSGIWSKIRGIFKDMGQKVGDAFGAAFKAAINGALSVVETVINAPISAINKLLDVINQVPGINISHINTMKLPRLAAGGIINVPGTGVNIGSAIVGEKGPEAVIPLSDDTLQRLANMIPITIDLTNTIDGRVLNRRLETIRANNNFTRNGG